MLFSQVRASRREERGGDRGHRLSRATVLRLLVLVGVRDTSLSLPFDCIFLIVSTCVSGPSDLGFIE